VVWLRSRPPHVHELRQPRCFFLPPGFRGRHLVKLRAVPRIDFLGKEMRPYLPFLGCGERARRSRDLPAGDQ
jgi:hypothetical protein